MAFPPGAQRNLRIAIPVLIVFFFIVSTAWVSGILGSLADRVRDSTGIAYSNGNGAIGPVGLGEAISALYEPIKLPVTARTYTDQRGKKFDVGGAEYWNQPLRKEVLIVDMDTRDPGGENGISSTGKIDWESVKAEGPGLLTVAHVNHFLYSQIHGYDYRFIQAKKIKDHWDSWIKPHVLKELLGAYRFVVFIDADTIVQHLEVPLEFLFNRWNIAPNVTSVALPVDTRQMVEGKENISADSKGRTVLNTGVIVMQNLPLSHAMLRAWQECTTEKRYPGCGQWKTKWSHEQRAFSEYIRYDFNPDGNNIVEIPCNDANGYPGLVGQAWVVDDCKGEFMRHFTVDKNLAKDSTANVLLQGIAEVLQVNFLQYKTRPS
ncbi:hypothetical protein N656DRAFT_720002 [Canariomyces notabilis]|uniref:Uncharacterized protein n=1 Tax=Canariomyces notabilis TaxID=2074819 RepID=A0AAN6QES6_9PEZI|nr:hypothetical protein N656DRAFT_720002 [Canariomyces arenarius]